MNLKKINVIFVCILFLGLLIPQNISSHVLEEERVTLFNKDFSSIYNPDEFIVQIYSNLEKNSYNSFMLSKSEIINLKNKLFNEKDFEKIISILKEYKLVEENINKDYLQTQYYEKTSNIKKDKYIDFLNKISSNDNNTFINNNCFVFSIGSMTFSVPPIFPLLFFIVPLGFFISGAGIFLTEGSQGGWYVYGNIYGSVIGFIGIWVNAIVFHMFLGFAVYAKAGF